MRGKEGGGSVDSKRDKELERGRESSREVGRWVCKEKRIIV